MIKLWFFQYSYKWKPYKDKFSDHINEIRSQQTDYKSPLEESSDPHVGSPHLHVLDEILEAHFCVPPSVETLAGRLPLIRTERLSLTLLQSACQVWRLRGKKTINTRLGDQGGGGEVVTRT